MTIPLSNLSKQNAGISNRTNKQALKKMKVSLISQDEYEKVKKDTKQDGHTNKLDEDPFKTLLSENKVIAPPFDMLTLSMLLEQNSVLAPCIEVLETNVAGFGHRFVPRKKEREGDIKKDEVLKEKTKLENFFNIATEESFTNFRKRLRKDLEATGNSYMEVIRNIKGEVSQFAHVQSYQMRLTKREDESIWVERPYLELQDDGDVKVAKLQKWYRFRKFVQSRYVSSASEHVSDGVRTIWFKEFGDPRVYDKTTGVELKQGDKNYNNPTMHATEIIHTKLYSPRSSYGLPRYVGNLLSIFGSRGSEEINFKTMENNNVPNMIIGISNGQLTQGSVERINSFMQNAISNSKNYSQVLVIEAESDSDEDGEDGNQTRLFVEPLKDQQINDALFQNYQEKNEKRIRRCFRFSSIFLGSSEELTRASLEDARKLADEQIFNAERDEEDSVYNRFIFPELGIVHHLFKSNSPNSTDSKTLVNILDKAEKSGGLTPRISRVVLEDILSIEMPPFPDNFDPDVPFSLTMAEAVKNKANMEPGSQVTALKNWNDKVLNALTGINTETVDPLIQHLNELNNHLEKEWSKELDEEHDHKHEE